MLWKWARGPAKGQWVTSPRDGHHGPGLKASAWMRRCTVKNIQSRKQPSAGGRAVVNGRSQDSKLVPKCHGILDLPAILRKLSQTANDWF